MSKLTSLTNARVKEAVRLQRQSSHRRESGLFCIESTRELARALAGGFVVRTIFHCPTMIQRPEVPGDVEWVEVTENVLAKMAYREKPEGFVAVVEAKWAALSEMTAARSPLFLVCSGLEKPGNVGAILRSADAAGAAAVMIDSPTFDLFNPHCVRASTGAVFGLPVVCDTPANLQQWLRDQRVLIVAATPEAQLTHLSFTMRGAMALVVGAEAEGLADDWRDAADLLVSIPMQGRMVDSLNVSVTAAVLLFDAMRHRMG